MVDNPYAPQRYEPGMVIDTPGVYAGVPDRVYHEDAALFGGEPSASSSGLRVIYHDGPAAWWVESPYNPFRAEREDTPAMALGRAAHTLLLGEAGFQERFAVRPERWDSWRTKESQAWRAEMEGAGRTILTPADLETIRGMAGLLPWQSPDAGFEVPESGLRNSRYVALGLMEGLIEHSLFWRDSGTGIWLKARPDVLPRASGVVADLKTYSRQRPDRAIWEHHYHQQAALVADGLREAAKIEMESFVLVMVQTRPPFRVTIHELTPHVTTSGEAVDPIEIGRRQNREALTTLARCFVERRWPAADGEPIPARMPDWYARSVDARTSMGEVNDAVQFEEDPA